MSETKEYFKDLWKTEDPDFKAVRAEEVEEFEQTLADMEAENELLKKQLNGKAEPKPDPTPEWRPPTYDELASAVDEELAKAGDGDVVAASARADARFAKPVTPTEPAAPRTAAQVADEADKAAEGAETYEDYLRNLAKVGGVESQDGWAI